jgi:taurine transport system substrate-binding protein
MEEYMKSVLSLTVALVIGFGAASASAQTKEVTFAYQDMLDPYRTLIDSHAIEKATGYKVNWRQFGGGGDVIRGMASGAVEIGEVGSAAAAAAVSQGMDLEVFWILDSISQAEQLVARDGSGINSIADLRGKRVATPFVSTSHYSLLTALKKAGVDPQDVRILNMRPPEIAAAWARGDLDATFIWDPVLSKVKTNGKVILSASDVGAPTFDAMMVSRAWAAKNKDFMVTLVSMMAKADAAYRDNKAEWTAGSPEVQAVARVSGADPKDVPAAMSSYSFPTLQQQASQAWLGGGANSGAARALHDTAEFLKAQGSISALAPDYSKFVTPIYVDAALQSPQ